MDCCRFFFNDTATTEIYTLSLHDALPIYAVLGRPEEGRHGHADGPRGDRQEVPEVREVPREAVHRQDRRRSEEHTSELQSQSNLVCRLLLEKKKKNTHSTRCRWRKNTRTN